MLDVNKLEKGSFTHYHSQHVKQNIVLAPSGSQRLLIFFCSVQVCLASALNRSDSKFTRTN